MEHFFFLDLEIKKRITLSEKKPPLELQLVGRPSSWQFFVKGDNLEVTSSVVVSKYLDTQKIRDLVQLCSIFQGFQA